LQYGFLQLQGEFMAEMAESAQPVVMLEREIYGRQIIAVLFTLSHRSFYRIHKNARPVK